MNLKYKKNKAAFTLIELIVVMAIMAIVAAIAIPSVGVYQKNRRNKNCTAQMKALSQEIQDTLTAGRFKDQDDANIAIARTCVNFVEGAKIGGFTAKNIDQFTYSGGDVELTGVCPNNGTYEINWDITQMPVTVTIKCDRDKKGDENISETATANIEEYTNNAVESQDYLQQNCNCVAKMVGAYVEHNGISLVDMNNSDLVQSYKSNKKFGTATEGFKDFCDSYNASWTNILKEANQYGESYTVYGNTVQSGSISAKISD